MPRGVDTRDDTRRQVSRPVDVVREPAAEAAKGNYIGKLRPY